ncbi:MAG: methyltransferase domain-containing protein [Planctomycetes bacterium]|nr:methyltransferase domain-containing protein [Planctomycetota bacterium]
MPIEPNLFERLILLKLNKGPGLILDFLGAQAFRAVCVAVRLGVFETLSGAPLTAAQTAHQIKANERGTALLLEALEALGYIKKKNGRYVNTPLTAKWLLRNSPTSLACGIPFLESMVFDRWEHLEESIRRGKPALYGYDWADQQPDRWRIYEEGMIAVARMVADEVVAKVKLPPTGRLLLDVGGGHGLYSIRFCRRYPGLSATVFDLPQALEVTRETIAAEGMGDRVAVQEGDFWIDDLSAGYDVALVFNIVHANLPDKNTELLRKVAGALNRGGLIVIMEQITAKVSSSTARVLTRLQALNYFNNLEAQTYSFDDINGWLTKVGFTNQRALSLRKIPGFGLVLGTKAN